MMVSDRVRVWACSVMTHLEGGADDDDEVAAVHVLGHRLEEGLGQRLTEKRDFRLHHAAAAACLPRGDIG